MTAFGKLIRTTAFRLTLAYLFLFALFAASLLGYFAWNTRRLITEQITTTVNAETGEISDIFGRRGLLGLVRTIENRALRPGANLYLVTTPAGEGGCRQCRFAGAGRDGDHRLVRDCLSAARRAGQRRSSRAGARHSTAAASGC